MRFHPHLADPPQPLVTPAPQPPDSGVLNRGNATLPHVSTSDLLFVHWSVGEWVWYSSLIALTVVMTVIAVTRLAWMLHAWRSTSHLNSTGFSTSPLPQRRSFSLLVPVRHEGILLSDTLDRLTKQDHPDFEVIVVVGDDDPMTELVARDAAERHPGAVSVVVDDSVSKNRAKALNRALKVARGDVIGVFNAGDDVHPRLLRLVDSRFSETAADVVQGGVQLMNFRASWWALRSALENYFSLRSTMHLHARSRSVSLGDSTVFIKRNWLDWSAGWDEACVAEGYELGVRLTAGGANVVVAYSPEVVTRQESPRGISTLVTQRTQSDLASLQVLGKEEWRRLPSRKHRLFARYQLSAPFLQAATALLVPVLILIALYFTVPTLIVLVTFVPLAVVVVTLAVEIAGLSEFGGIYRQRVRLRDYLGLILGTFPYQVVLAAASVNALITSTERDYSLSNTEESVRDQGAAVAEAAPVRAAR